MIGIVEIFIVIGCIGLTLGMLKLFRAFLEDSEA